MRVPFILTAALITSTAPLALHAQASAASSNPVVSSLKGLNDITTRFVLASAKMVDEKLYAFQPTKEVRTMGQLFAHIADAQYLFCSTAAGEKSPKTESFEETRTSKVQIIAALEGAFAYCDKIYAAMTDAKGTTMVDLFGNKMAAAAVLAFNSAHNYEHYGNLVTYMRINGVVPPSSM